MDLTRLYNASYEGDVDALLVLLAENPLIIQASTFSDADTPLHIASMLGHSQFLKTILDRDPKLAFEPNQQGLYPIHVASSRGFIEIVRDLSKVDTQICLLMDCDGRTPLHLAARKGRLEIIEHLVKCCTESIRKLTYRGETVLHVAVKNSQFEAVKLLVSILGGFNMIDELINCFDEEGDTILHLAAARKQVQVVKFLLSETKVNLNAVNRNGNTALNIASLYSSEPDYMLISKTLRRQVHRESPETQTSPSELQLNITSCPREASYSWRPSNQVPPGQLDRRLESLKTGILVLASMFATFSFDAALNPPGGVWQDWPPNGQVINPQDLAKVGRLADKIIKESYPYPWKYFLPYPHANFTSPELFGPGKAMNLALASYDFLAFIYYDALCFITSLATVMVLMLTAALRRWQSLAIITMTLLIAIFAILFYENVLSLVTNEQLARWALCLGFIQLASYGTGVIVLALFVEFCRSSLFRKLISLLY